jgi:hypothetical protein
MGLKATPQTMPLVNVVRQSPGAALAIGGFVLLATVRAVQIARRPSSSADEAEEPDIGAG